MQGVGLRVSGLGVGCMDYGFGWLNQVWHPFQGALEEICKDYMSYSLNS